MNNLLNNISTKLTAAVGVSDTSITVTAGDGANFALATVGNTIRITVAKVSGYREIAWEEMDVTARATDVLSVVRAREGSTALAFSIGDTVSIRATAGLLSGINNPNMLINGNFNQWQPYTAAVTGTNAMLADNWRMVSGGSTHSSTQGTVTDGTDDVFFDPSDGAAAAQYFATVAVTSVAGAANYVALVNRMEGLRRFAGKTITVSFWAKAASGTPAIGLHCSSNFGSGGAPSSQVNHTGEAKTLSTSWTKFTHTVTIPSVSGKTFGTTPNTSFCQLAIYLDAGSNYNSLLGSMGQATKTVSIAQVKVEVGTLATQFMPEDPEVELAKCQRYIYKKFPGLASKYLTQEGHAISTSSFRGFNKFPVTMRAAPTALSQSGTAGDYTVERAGVATQTVCTGVPTFGGATVEQVWTDFPNSGATFVNGAAGAAYTSAATTTGYLMWDVSL